MNTQPDLLHADEALQFYAHSILGPIESKRKVAHGRGFEVDKVHPINWEILAAELLDDHKASSTYGADLRKAEVKSRLLLGGFEYQFHRVTGLEKNYHDAHIAHVLISYSNDYRDFDVRFLRPDQVHNEVLAWRERVNAAYGPRTSDQPKRRGNVVRCRPGFSFGFVNRNALLLMSVRDGQLVHVDKTPLSKLLPDQPRCNQPECVAIRASLNIS